jgi:DNA primase
MTVAGDQSRLFNTPAMLKHSPIIAVTEGELDAVAAQELCGIPAVGVAGATNWKPHYVPLFAGYRDVFILADGDEPGLQFANTVAKSLPNAKVVPMPSGLDVNSLVLQQGLEAVRDRIGI